MSINISDPVIKGYLENDNVETNYNMNYLPSALTEPTTEKAVRCLFEQIDQSIYEKEARMSAFRTTHERLVSWIKALNLYYYEIMGKNTDKKIEWADNPQQLSPTECLKSIIIDIKNQSNDRLYKITFFIRTGLIQAQGNNHQVFALTDFPELLSVVQQLAGPLKLGNPPTSKPVIISAETNINPGHETGESHHDTHLKPVYEASHARDVNNNQEGLVRLQKVFTDSILKLEMTLKSNKTEIISCIESKTCDKSPKQSSADSISTLKSELKLVRDENYSLKVQISEEKKNHLAGKEHYEKLLKHEHEMHQTNQEQQKSIMKDVQKNQDYYIDQLTQKNEEIDTLNQTARDLSIKLNISQDEIIQLKMSFASQINTEMKPRDDTTVTSQQGSRENKPSVLLIGTSNIGGIDAARITDVATVTKEIKYTMKQATDFLKDIMHPPTIIVVHILTNDLRGKNPNQTVDELFGLATKICSRWPLVKLIISATTPRMDSMDHSTNAQIINVLLKQKFTGVDNIYLVEHNNMLRYGNPNRDLLKDDKYHLTDKGIAILASNLKRGIHTALDMPVPQRRPRSMSRTRQSQQKKGQSHK